MENQNYQLPNDLSITVTLNLADFGNLFGCIGWAKTCISTKPDFGLQLNSSDLYYLACVERLYEIMQERMVNGVNYTPYNDTEKLQLMKSMTGPMGLLLDHLSDVIVEEVNFLTGQSG